MPPRRGPTHYELLGVAADASAEDVRRAFRALAKTAHPDVGGDPDHFRRLRDAHDTLTDPRSRRRYDDEHGLGWLRRGVRSPNPGAWQGRQGTFTGDVEFPAWLRDVTDAPWEGGGGGGTGAGGGAGAGGDARPPGGGGARVVEPAEVLWWWTGRASFDPVATGAVVVVVSGADVVACDAFTGQELWRSGVGAPVVAPPAVVPTGVVVVDAERRLHGLDLGTGAVVWRHQGRERVRGPVALAGLAVVAAGPRLVGLDPGTGATAWTARLVAEAETVHGVGEVVVATTVRRSLEAVDAANGRHRWVHRPVPAPLLAPEAGAGLVWLAAGGGRLVGLDPATGGSVAPSAPSLALVGMAGDDEQLLVTSAGPARLTALDHVGRTRWQAALDRAAPAPALEPGLAHVVDPGGRLTTFESRAGRVLGEARLAFEPAGAPVVAAGRVLVADRAGTVWAHVPPTADG